MYAFDIEFLCVEYIFTCFYVLCICLFQPAI